jgi:hypothetical protein
MPAEDAVALLDRLGANGVDACVGGGWGVDTLLGQQTPEHADLDLWVPADKLERRSQSVLMEEMQARLHRLDNDLTYLVAKTGPDGLARRRADRVHRRGAADEEACRARKLSSATLPASIR